MARVVGELDTVDDGFRRYGVQYTGIPSPLRDVISRLVFKKQRQAIVERRREAELGRSTVAEIDPVDSGKTAE